MSQPDVPALFFRRGPGGEADDSDFYPLDGADWDHDLATWQEECERSRDHAAGKSLDDTGSRRGSQCSLRWIYTHMVEEYARHNGHADLIRELVRCGGLVTLNSGADREVIRGRRVELARRNRG
jgi:hypothetical protein